MFVASDECRTGDRRRLRAGTLPANDDARRGPGSLELPWQAVNGLRKGTTLTAPGHHTYRCLTDLRIAGRSTRWP